jgi:hypothetical protein
MIKCICACSNVTIPVAAATRMIAVSRKNLIIWNGWRGVDWTLICQTYE